MNRDTANRVQENNGEEGGPRGVRGGGGGGGVVQDFTFTQ